MSNNPVDFLIQLDAIEIAPDRQRSNDVDLSDLVQSLGDHGQLQNIVLDHNNKLIAGWRRFNAAKLLGWTHIKATAIDTTDIDPRLIEYAENAHRKNLRWQEECIAVKDLHESLVATNTKWSVEQSARVVGIDSTYVNKMLQVCPMVESDPASADKLSINEALARVRAAARAKKDTLLAQIGNEFEIAPADILSPKATASDQPDTKQPDTQDQTLATDTQPASPPALVAMPVAAPKPAELLDWEFLNTSCYDWAKAYDGKLFNFVHLDPPYGIGVNDSKSQLSSRASVNGAYSDTAADWQQALNFWVANPPLNVINQHYCTMVVWHNANPDVWQELKTAAIIGGWKFMPFPFIAHKSNNSGTIPNPATDFRRTYEQAMFLYRGTSVVQNLAASLACSFPKSDIHTTEKPQAALQHIMRGLCGERTRMVDPFSGSGSAIRAAMGMHETFELAVGIEFLEAFHSPALASLNKAYGMTKVSRALNKGQS